MQEFFSLSLDIGFASPFIHISKSIYKQIPEVAHTLDQPVTYQRFDRYYIGLTFGNENPKTNLRRRTHT